MKILEGNPPIIDEARNVFRLPEGVVFTYGDILYNPSGRLVDPPLMKHEELHSTQQGDNPALWWKRYLADKYFRLSQEIPAYQVQYKYAKKFIKDREKYNKYLMFLAKDLSGEMYGSILTFQEAIEAIKSKQLFDFKT